MSDRCKKSKGDLSKHLIMSPLPELQVVCLFRYYLFHLQLPHLPYIPNFIHSGFLTILGYVRFPQTLTKPLKKMLSLPEKPFHFFLPFLKPYLLLKSTLKCHPRSKINCQLFCMLISPFLRSLVGPLRYCLQFMYQSFLKGFCVMTIFVPCAGGTFVPLA